MKLIRKFIPYYKPYIGVFVMDLICATILSAIDLMFPQLLRVLRATLFQESADVIMASLGKLALFLIAIYLVRALCRHYVIYQGHIMGAKMETDMRQDIFVHYQRLSFSYFDRNNTGEMMSRIVSDLFDITELAHHGPEIILISGLKVIGAFVILFCINVPLTLILLAVALAMTFYCAFMRKYMRQVFADNRKKIAVVNSRIQDSLAGIRVVKSFANEDVEENKFAGCNQDFLKSKVFGYPS